MNNKKSIKKGFKKDFKKSLKINRILKSKHSKKKHLIFLIKMEK